MIILVVAEIFDRAFANAYLITAMPLGYAVAWGTVFWMVGSRIFDVSRTKRLPNAIASPRIGCG